MTEWTSADLARLDALIETQEQSFFARQKSSAAMYERATKVLAGGATSSWQIARPQMIWMSHGIGSKVYDVDGIEYSDFNGGYGVGLMGHAHPAVVEAVARRVKRGTHFAQPTEDAIAVADDARRAMGSSPLALLQLRNRNDDGCGPSHACDHGARPHHQGRGLLSRPPRLGDGVGRQ